jgi:hypothetical protein
MLSALCVILKWPTFLRMKPHYFSTCPVSRADPFVPCQGDTYEEAMENIKDVIQMCLEELKEEKKKVDLKYPEIIGMKWVEVTI